MKPNQLSQILIGSAISVHRELGPGLDEADYEQALSRELTTRGVRHQTQHPLPVEYRGVRLECGYRLDLLLEEQMVVELKSVDFVLPIHRAQLLTYLRLSGTHLGLLLNFNVALLKQGIERMVYNFNEEGMSTAEEQRTQRGEEPVAPAIPAAGPLVRAEDDTTRLTEAILGAAIEVHRVLGPGLLRSAYEACLCHELSRRGVLFELAQEVRLTYRGLALPRPTKVEVLVDGRIPLKVVSVDTVQPVHEAQLLGQLRQGGWQSGLLLNFNAPTLAQGIRRCVNQAWIERP